MSSLPVPIEPNPTVFPRERQATFLAALAATGSVRSASATAGVSHQTAYRALRVSARSASMRERSLPCQPRNYGDRCVNP